MEIFDSEHKNYSPSKYNRLQSQHSTHAIQHVMSFTIIRKANFYSPYVATFSLVCSDSRLCQEVRRQNEHSKKTTAVHTCRIKKAYKRLDQNESQVQAKNETDLVNSSVIRAW